MLRNGRLIAGANTLAELSPKGRRAVSLMEHKEAAGATFEDAELLAKYAGLRSDHLREKNL